MKNKTNLKAKPLLRRLTVPIKRKLQLLKRNLKQEVKSLKDTVGFYFDAAPKYLRFKKDQFQHKSASLSETDFRKAQCIGCVLLKKEVVDGKNVFRCNSNKFASRLNKTTELVDKKEVDTNPNKFVTYTKYGNIKKIKEIDTGKEFIRGCGCRLFTDTDPIKISANFKDSELAKVDGTGPCPLGRWSKEEFLEYKTKNATILNYRSDFEND